VELVLDWRRIKSTRLKWCATGDAARGLVAAAARFVRLDIVGGYQKFLKEVELPEVPGRDTVK
jgi:hypothetical protein